MPEGRRTASAVAGSILRAVLRAPVGRRCWFEVVHCLVGFPLGVAGLVPLVALLLLGSALTVSLVGAFPGLLVLVAALGLSRSLCAVHRRLAALLLGERLPPGAPARRGRGVLGRLDTRLRDGTSWRSTAYLLLSPPLSALGLLTVVVWCGGLLDLVAPVRWAFHEGWPGASGAHGLPVVSPLPFGGLTVSSYPGTFLAAGIGAATVLAAPWPTRAVVMADRWLIRALLGPGSLDQRVRDLEETRALAVDDSVALLRRLERDLHDGAQVRLVALAMSLDMAREKLGGDDEPPDTDRVRQLVESAHRNATEALAELRDLARGIHPPVLDDGLPDALATLAARSPVPVESEVDVSPRPTAAIESIAYFCAAELVANVIKHSGARRARVEAVRRDGALRLRVTDDGRGGARPGGGSGLTGLAQRVRTVDGTVDVASPAGGPTVVTVVLPLRA